MKEASGNQGDDWQLRKLKAETIKTEHEARSARNAPLFQAVATTAAFLTTVVAISALLLTNLQQKQQQQREDVNLKAERYEANVRMLGEGTSSLAQLSAIDNIGAYWDEPAYRQRVASLLISAANEIHDRTVLTSIEALIRAHPDTMTLRLLALSNRRIQTRIRQLGYGPNDLMPMQPVYHPASRVDSLLSDAYTSLGWNIDLLISTINALNTIQGLDLSHVVFSRVASISHDSTPRRVSLIVRKDEGIFAPGLLFKSVNFTAANFCGVHFSRTSFVDTRLDSVFLAETVFQQSHFQGRTTLRAFQSQIAAEPNENDAPEHRRLGNNAPSWEKSEIVVGAFYPMRYSDEEYRELLYFTFIDSSWKIPTTHLGTNRFPPIAIPESGDSADLTVYGGAHGAIRPL